MKQLELSQEVLKRIADAVESVRFGSVQIVIHDSRVVQIEKAEKIRIPPSADLAPGGPHQSTRATRPLDAAGG